MKLKDGIVFLNKIILIFLIKLIFLKKSEEFLRLLIKQQKGFFVLREMTNLFLKIKKFIGGKINIIYYQFHLLRY